MGSCDRFFGVRWSVLAVAALAYGAIGGGCGSDNESGGRSCPVGQEGCPCTPGGSCDSGLSCFSDLCVVDDAGSTGGRGQDGTGGDDAGTGGDDAGTGGDDAGTGGDGSGGDGVGGDATGGEGTGGGGSGGDGTGGDGAGGTATGGDGSGGTGGDSSGGSGTGGDAAGGAAGQAAGGTGAESSGGTGGEGAGGVAGQGGDSGTGGAPTLQYLECTGDECCLTNCFSQSTCGPREFTGCTDDLCGGTGSSPCNEDVLALPEWFGPRECVLYWIEGGTEMGYVAVFAYCPCENASSQVLTEEVLFEVTSGFDGTCDFSTAPEPACELDYSECP